MSIDKKAFARNLASAIVAQGVIFVASMLMSLVVPKLLGVEGYGYWQLFILYASYAALFHLGLNDGVYLINGGTPLDELNKGNIESQFFVSLLYEVFIAVAITFYSLVIYDSERSFVLLTFSIYI